MPLRTGYERVLGNRTDDLFCTTAKQTGTVVAKDAKHITVAYADGSKVSVELGRRYGVSSGTTLPHQIDTPLKVGDTVVPGDVIAYNSNYFTPDSIYPKKAIYKGATLATTALLECTNTLEDSCEISQALAERLATGVAHVRTIKVAFDQQVRGLVKVGDRVDIESILCTIENSTEGSSDLFDEEALATLSILGNLTPRAKYVGVVERIEVVYHGDITEMSESLGQLTKQSDGELSTLYRKLGKRPVTGQIGGDIRVDGTAMDTKTAAIKIYIRSSVSMGSGDKSVFSNQLKTTVGRVMTGINQTESGTNIDAIFGYKSINDRIVNSAVIIGTTNTLLRKLSKLAVDAFKS